jgi:winged helix DNA-binding protein
MKMDISPHAAIAEERLRRQLLTHRGRRAPKQVISWLGAVQAQEYEHAKWALGLRMRDGAGGDDIERAFNAGSILRTHVLRPTWHFVTADDIRWLLDLTAAGVHRRMAPYDRQLGLDISTKKRASRVFERALRNQRFLTRAELGDALRRAGVPMTSIALAHTALYAELEGIICSGPRRGKQFTYALVSERAPQAVTLPRDEALAALATRFFRSHGPATARDFAWWSGLSAGDAKRSIQIINARHVEVAGRTYWTTGPPPRGAMREATAHLLPIYDEYLVSYRDREAVPHAASTSPGPRFATYQHTVVVSGQVAGAWRRVSDQRALRIHVSTRRKLTSSERAAITQAVGRYEAFMGVPVDFSIS